VMASLFGCSIEEAKSPLYIVGLALPLCACVCNFLLKFLFDHTNHQMSIFGISLSRLAY